MRFIHYYVASLAWLSSSTVSAFGRHAAQHGLLQVPAAFAHPGINLYPTYHPDHDPDDLNHLVPQVSKELYYSQEGHRPALHGAKHAQLQATFPSPAVVLEHSSHIKDVFCEDDRNHIKVCFKTPEALTTVENSWKKEMDSETFILITYHIGCGHLTGEHRSFFRASQPVFDGWRAGLGNICDALAKRQSVKRHVRVVKPDQEVLGNTVDLTKDAQAVKNFFGTDRINTDMPDTDMGELDSLSDKGLVKRDTDILSWIVEGIQSVIETVFDFFKMAIKTVRTVAQVIVKYAAVSLNLIMVPFGVPFDQAYHADIPFNYNVNGMGFGSDLGSSLGGTSNNLTVAKQGKAVWIECDSCGARANFSLDGKLAFSISDGLSKAEVSFINQGPFVLDAIFNITVDSRALKDKNSKYKSTWEIPIVSIPITDASISIPKILTIGAQVDMKAAVSVYADAHVEIRAGARFSISDGRLVLNVMDPNKNEASGFKPSLEPVFGIKGNAVFTADLAVPVGVEAGLDVLSGKWKKTIGVYTAPSVYITARFSTGEGHACNNKIEFRAGAKNRVYSSALGIWEREFKELGHTFWETGIGCLWLDGWNATQVEPTKINNRLLTEVAEKFGGEQYLASNKMLNFTQPGTIIQEDNYYKNKENPKLKELPKTQGFRLVQDANQTATLVSGTDGYIYMVDNSMDYDISSPWGGLEVEKNIFSYDVFGRLIYYNSSRVSPCTHFYPNWTAILLCGDDWTKRMSTAKAEERRLPSMLEVGVSDAEKMPQGVKAATLSVMKDKKTEIYGVTLERTTISKDKSGKVQQIWYPTVCRIPGYGLRLYASEYLVDEKGIAGYGQKKVWNPRSPKVHSSLQKDYKLDRKLLNLGDNPKVCRTVRLTSDLKSTIQGGAEPDETTVHGPDD